MTETLITQLVGALGGAIIAIVIATVVKLGRDSDTSE